LLEGPGKIPFLKRAVIRPIRGIPLHYSYLGRISFSAPSRITPPEEIEEIGEIPPSRRRKRENLLFGKSFDLYQAVKRLPNAKAAWRSFGDLSRL
jgi:hypothetical protein